jgi:hypothetical protein
MVFWAGGGTMAELRKLDDLVKDSYGLHEASRNLTGFAVLSLRVAVEALFEAYSYLAELPPEQDLSGFDRLGFDVVQYSDAINWGCSPLSCNSMYQHHAVNRYCLIDTVERAVEAARSFGQKEPEPGPYIIIEVFRERESGHPTGG